MELQDRNYEICLPDSSIRPFEQKMLESGLCSFAIPMHFVRHGKKIRICYDCSGYTSLKALGRLPLPLAFEILEKVFLCLRTSGEYLISPDRMQLDLELVYFREESRDVRLLFLPGTTQDSSSRELIHFLNQFKDLLPPDGQRMIEKIASERTRRNRSFRELANIVGEIRRELAHSSRT